MRSHGLRTRLVCGRARGPCAVGMPVLLCRCTGPVHWLPYQKGKAGFAAPHKLVPPQARRPRRRRARAPARRNLPASCPHSRRPRRSPARMPASRHAPRRARPKKSRAGRLRRCSLESDADCTGAASPGGAGSLSAHMRPLGNVLHSRTAPVVLCGRCRSRVTPPAARARSSGSWTPHSASWLRRARPRPPWRPKRTRWRRIVKRGRPSATRCKLTRCGGRWGALCHACARCHAGAPRSRPDAASNARAADGQAPAQPRPAVRAEPGWQACAGRRPPCCRPSRLPEP